MIDACVHLRATKQRVCATKAITPTIRVPASGFDRPTRASAERLGLSLRTMVRTGEKKVILLNWHAVTTLPLVCLVARSGWIRPSTFSAIK